jgi:D-serine deaminase-like pyridoxal phosphate-dependent protein
MGAVRGAPELTVATLSQEHGLIRAASPAGLDGRFPVGAKLEIVPNHSCLTVAHFDVYHVIRGSGDAAAGGEGGRVVDRWTVERGR